MENESESHLRRYPDVAKDLRLRAVKPQPLTSTSTSAPMFPFNSNSSPAASSAYQLHHVDITDESMPERLPVNPQQLQTQDGLKFVCKACGRGYKYAHCLSRHQWKCLGLRSMKCHVCSAQFHRMDHLRIHLRRHSLWNK